MAEAINPKIEGLKRRGEKLRSDRGTLNNHLEEIADVILPNALGFTGRRTAGEKRMQRIYDETGVNANELFAANLGGLVTNPSSKWFSVRIVNAAINEQPEVKKWRSDVEDVMYQEMYAPGSGLTPTLDEFYLTLGAFGTSEIFIGESMRGGLLFQARSLAECYHAENPDGIIDTMFRFFPFTVRQVVETSGWDASAKTRKLYADGKLDDMIQVVHAVYPRDNTNPKAKSRKAMAFASCYFELETCHELEESGFPEYPYVVARWRKAAGEQYGRSPGMTALPAVKMLQAIESDVAKAMQLMARPPVFLRDDGVTGQIRVIPGGTNYWRGNPNEGIMKYPVAERMPDVEQWRKSIQDRVRTIFYTDVLQINESREMTAYETRQRKTERMRLQGPNIGRLDSEMLGPFVERVYGILSRKGKLPPAPDALDQQQMTVEFVSPLASVQKQEQLSGLQQLADYVAPFGDYGLQALAKEVNMGRTIRGVAEVLQVDPDFLNTPEEMAALQQQEAQQRSMMAAQPMADAADSGASAVKQLTDAGAQGGFNPQALMAALAKGGAAAQQQRAA